MKKLLSKLKHPVVAITLLSLAAICFIWFLILPNYPYKQTNGTVNFTNPHNFSTSENNWNIIVDAGKSIYCTNEKDSLVYAININDFPYDNGEIIDATFNDENHIFCHIAVYNENAHLTDMEAIWEIDSKGNILHEITHYDYTTDANPPSRQVRIRGIHFYENKIHYLYKDVDTTLLVAINPRTPSESEQTSVKENGYGEIIQCHKAPDGQFIILKNNGEMGYLTYEGEYTPIYKATYNAKTHEGIFPYDVYMTSEGLYMLAGQDELHLYKWTDNKDWEILIPVNKFTNTTEDVDLFSHNLGEFKGSPALNINEFLYLLEDSDLTLYEPDFFLPASLSICLVLKSILPVISVILLIIGLPLGIGNLMKWRFTILSKQLLSTIPVVFIMLGVVITIMFSSMINLSTEDILRETIAINEIAAKQFSDEDLSSITGFESVDNGYAKDLSDRLRDFINGNNSQWSNNYNMAIYVRTMDEEFICVATSDDSDQFMASTISTETPIYENFYENTHTFTADVGYGGEEENLHLVLLTPIYGEDGSYDAIILLNATQISLTDDLIMAGISLLINVTIWIALLIIVITIVSAFNAKSLRQAQTVVSQIAGGDFSKRVEKHSKDEVGEICAGVNDMAARLEDFFEERIRNEQFYYKFVPEKFRELLHKENFTDLVLGDAQSADLSILFCDIRAFSLNSEMMTARESFDFVNKIYGIAGPIVRKHNGFIDKYIGDAIMALFESADNAIAAGVELYNAIVLNPNPQETFGLPYVKIGVGIHSGMARIGIVGEEERMSGTVISNTVNISSRIESLTKRYGAGMIISKDTLDRMKNPDALSTRYLGMVQVAGVNEVSALYEVLDCLTNEQRTLREQTKNEFREAVRLFHTGNLQESVELFKEVKKHNSEDIAPELYISYIEDKLLRGDNEHNIFQFKNK